MDDEFDFDEWKSGRLKPARPEYGDRLGEGFAMSSGDYEDLGGLFEDGDEYSPWT